MVEIKVQDDTQPTPDGEPPAGWPSKGDIK